MPARDLAASLEDKFGFTVKQGKGHEKYRLTVDGKYVAHTQVSRDGADLGNKLLGMLARQLRVTKGDLEQMVECSISKDEYIAKVT